MDLYDWITDCCSALRSSTNKDELQHRLLAFLNSADYSGFSFVESDISGSEFSIHSCTYSPQWIRRYLDKGYGSIDPILDRMLTETTPFFWGAEDYLKSKNKEVVDFFKDCIQHGINNGISCPMKYGEKIRLFTAVSGNKNMKYDEKSLSIIKIISENYNMIFSLLEARSINSLSPIYSNREKQAITLAALGATNHDTGLIIGISPKTAERQLQSAREKTWARTQAIAAAFAVDTGIIRLSNNNLPQLQTPVKLPIKGRMKNRGTKLVLG